MDISSLYRMYEDNLSGKTLTVHTREIGGSARKDYVLRFFPENADHLIGAGSDWHDRKVEAFSRMCMIGTWQMVGDYVDSMGDKLSADILVGGTNCVFGFREADDGDFYVPVTCLLLDIRDYVYQPIMKIERID